MAAHGWSRRFRFPGYDGAMPKSLRSSRGRGKYQHKVNKSPRDWGLFELLATVAGQVLQENNLSEGQLKRQNDLSKEQEKATENEGNVQYHPQAGFSRKPTDCSYKSKDVRNTGITITAVERSVNTKEAFGSSESAEEALKEKHNVLGSREKFTHSFDSIVKPQVLESKHCVWKGANLALSKPNHPDVVVYHKCHEQCDRLRSEEGSSMTGAHQSCAGIEEDSTSVHTKPCKFVNNIGSEIYLDSRQNLVYSTPKDDDDNFSVSIPLKGCLSNGSSQKLLVKDFWQEELHCGSVKMEPPIGSKRKYFQAMAQDANVGSSSLNNTKATWGGAKSSSKDGLGSSPVKVNIKSFTVPELRINLPKTATVANLKRAVMDAAINVLGGGLNVRVLYQGKKILDESATLVQMGISSRERLDSLAFMLEPDRCADTTMRIEEPLFGFSKASNESAAWYQISALSEEKGAKKGRTLNPEPSTQAQSNRAVESGSKAPMILCRSLVLHPGLKDMEALDIVRAEQGFHGKRRVRRPFSVVEVAALVQAVEQLGTGRWREVKLQAFEHARHRTYVDLKDKWKTLVHTAHIAPHQRRGEPVPQELLDRVLKAHTYWAAPQSKQQAVPGM